MDEVPLDRGNASDELRPLLRLDRMTDIEKQLRAFSEDAFDRAVQQLRGQQGFLGTSTRADVWRNVVAWRRFYRPSAFYGHRLGANVSILSEYGDLRDLFVTDSIGVCRNAIDGADSGDRVQDAKARGVPVLAFFGGSTMQGVGCRLPEFSIPALVERVLREAHGISTVCLNHGVAGWCSAEQLHFLMHETGYGPDVCVFHDGWNCCWNFYHGVRLNAVTAEDLIPHWGPGTSLRHCEYDVLNAIGFRAVSLVRRAISLWGNRVLGWVAGAVGSPRWSAFWDWLAASLFTLRPPDVLRGAAATPLPLERRDELLAAAAAEYLRIDSLAAAVCTARGVKFLHCFQPLLATTRKPLTAREQILQRGGQRMSNPEIFSLFPDFVRKAGRSAHLTDLTDVLDDVEDEVFVDGGHLNRYGNYHVARHIAGELLARGYLGRGVELPHERDGYDATSHSSGR